MTYFDATPGIGHVKGIAQIIAGDEEGGVQALKTADRSTLVVTGGIVGGLIGGPMGIAIGATCAGTVMDYLNSMKDKKPQGIKRGVDKIMRDIENGKVPVESVAETAGIITGDISRGLGTSTPFTNL